MVAQIRAFWKKETVLVISALCALATMVLVPPDGAYSAYIDLRVLCLLMCLMIVVAGFQTCGAFKWMAFQLLRRGNNGRVLSIILVMLPFFSSMLVTNDVALLTFVPFTLLLLEQIGCRKAVIPVLVLQTIAANLGSMATPVGNPQNLFLYATYNLSVGEFFSATLPLTFLSLLCLVAAAFPVLPKELPELNLEEETLEQPKRLAVYAVLFVLCLLTVFHILPYGAMTILVVAVIAIMDSRLLKDMDVALLATFVCFFVASGNLGRMEIVQNFLEMLLEKSTLLTAVATSQFISNVPAAVLLSGFSDQWRPLLEGVNIGGLGTPIASLASLITLKLYLRSENAKIGKFLLVFTVANVAALVILLANTMIF